MLERYFLKRKEITLGEIIREDGIFRFELDEHAPSNPYMYPYEFYEFGKYDFNYKVTHEDIKLFIEDRAMDPNRVGIWEYLYSLGLTEYDAWEICKKTKAIAIEDFFWITKERDEDYRKVLPRF